MANYIITPEPEESVNEIFTCEHKSYKYFWDKACQELNPNEIPLKKLKHISWRDIHKRAIELMKQEKPEEEDA